MSAALYRDDPRRRLPWLVPGGALLSLAAVALFLRLLIVAPPPPPPLPIELDVMELPPTPPVPVPAPVAPAPPAAEPAPLPPAATQPEPPAHPQPAPPQPAAVPAMPPTSRPAVALPQAPPPVLERLIPGAPLTADQRETLNKIYFPGNDGGHFAEGESAEESARSKKAPPLTAEQWKALDKIYKVGTGNSPETVAADEQGVASARSKKAPPLTAAQWNALDRIYHVGRGGERGFGEATAAESASNAAANALSFPTGKLVASRIVVPPQPGVVVSRGHGALPSNQPLPEVPDRLLDSVAHWVAIARFKVAADGSAEVELTKPFPDAEFNDALLDCLRQWRFFPAAEMGRSVASVFEVQISAE